MELRETDLPTMYVSADATSIKGQQQYLFATSARLWAAVLAAAAAAVASYVHIGEIELFGLIAAVLFVVALGFEVWLLADKPEQDWYDGRAIAESAKTLAWKYSVAGVPFEQAVERPDLLLAESLAELPDMVGNVIVVPKGTETVTPQMRALRATSLDVRRSTYLEWRVMDQEKWYAKKAEYSVQRAKRWRLTLITFEFIGVILALFKAFGIFDVDLASVTASAIGAGAAWLSVKQHESLARSYTLASHELLLIAARLSEVSAEADWAREVGDSEDAISREHTMWRAARTSAVTSHELRGRPRNPSR